MAAYRAAADLGFGPAQWRLAQLGRERDPGYEGLDVWVGLVHVKPMPGNDVLEGGLGAFASPYALGRNATAYRVTVEKHFGEIGLEVQEVEDVELFKERVWRRDPPLEAFELAARVSLSTPVVWDSLNVYMSEDEE